MPNGAEAKPAVQLYRSISSGHASTARHLVPEKELMTSSLYICFSFTFLGRASQYLLPLSLSFQTSEALKKKRRNSKEALLRLTPFGRAQPQPTQPSLALF